MEILINKKRNSWLAFGIVRGFGLGFFISRWHLTIDFICFYISLEL